MSKPTSSKQSRAFQTWLISGFTIAIVLSSVVAGVSVYLLQTVAASKDSVIYDGAQDLILAERLHSSVQHKIATLRGYIIDRTSFFGADVPRLQVQTLSDLEQIKRATPLPEESQLLELIGVENKLYDDVINEIYIRVSEGAEVKDLLPILHMKARHIRLSLEEKLARFVAFKEKDLRDAKDRASTITSKSLTLLLVIASIAVLCVLALCVALMQTLGRIYQKSLLATHSREEILRLVAHDLRNPLTAIQMFAESIGQQLRNQDVHPYIPEFSDKIVESTTRMNRMVKDLLDFEKIESGKLSLDLKREKSSKVIAEAIDMMNPVATAKGVELVNESSDGEDEIYCDIDRILQVFSNLIGNAIKFTESGGRIYVGSSEENDRIRFWVRDTGPGVAPEHLPHLFKRSWKPKSTEHAGHGLGLVIAKGIIKQHLGEISVASEPGMGATFYFTLPSFSLHSVGHDSMPLSLSSYRNERTQ